MSLSSAACSPPDLPSKRWSTATGRTPLQAGARVLAGQTNVGKSSLFNLLLKEERSIVSPYRGTTRDYIEADLEVGGIPIRLYDTAGLRESDDLVEREGIVRTERLIGEADLVIHLVDSTDLQDIPAEDERTIVVYNKSDLAPVGADKLAISAQSGEGVSRLLSAVEERLKRSCPPAGMRAGHEGAAVATLGGRRTPASSRELARDEGAGWSPSSSRRPWGYLGELTGEVRSDDVWSGSSADSA